jgi:hypothetical protein
MKSNAQRKPPAPTARPAYRTLGGWALQSSAGQNIEQQYQELLQLREKVGSLAKAAVESRQQPKRKSRD